MSAYVTDAHWLAIEHRLYPAIKNLLPATQSRTLYEDAYGLPDGAVILEIGAYYGLSTCALAYGCLGTKKRVWTIDTFCGKEGNTNIQDGADYYAAFCENVAQQGLSAYVTAMIGKSAQFYASWTRPLDLLFIDGDHNLLQQDLGAFFPHLKPGGILLVHDVLEDTGRRLYPVNLPPLPFTYIAGNLARGVKPK